MKEIYGEFYKEWLVTSTSKKLKGIYWIWLDLEIGKLKGNYLFKSWLMKYLKSKL